MSNPGFGDLPYGDDQAAGTYAQYLWRHPQSVPVAKREPEPPARKPVSPWRRAIVFVLVGLVGLFAALGLVKAMIYAWSNHSRIVTVCDVDRPLLAEHSHTYEFETTGGDFAIIHPDGAQVLRGHVYMFRWFGNKPLTSFDEVEGATPTSCE